jgi:hypothetical protein
VQRRDWCRLTGSALLAGAAASAAGAARGGVQAPIAPVRHPPLGVLPDLGCWFWIGQDAFRPGAYRKFLDAVAAHSVYDLLTTSLRAPNAEIVRPEVHNRLREATLYAREQGLGIVLDLDVRLARRAFLERYPDELQEMLRLRECDLQVSTPTELRIESQVLNDHYTGGGAEPYLPIGGRFVRAYAYCRSGGEIDPSSLADITVGCEVLEASPHAVRVRLPAAAERGRQACVMVAFAHLTPDVFAPHLLSFQRELLQRYADVRLAGVCKDEWGFPPCYDANPQHNDFWYSEAMRRVYATYTHGRDLLRDCLLMYAAESGREAERQAAINQFLALSRRRNGDIERHFYGATKAVFGRHAVVATHPTWFPYPGVEEFKKNGLSWWVAKRDWAQTDELTPYCCRTSLAKKWRSPVWYNMYYSPHKADYERGIWSYALAGGRMNCHPLYPLPGGSDHYELLRGGLMRGMARIRLLNYISRSPLDCPVAVVFGHACAMNWAGPGYGDSGVSVAEAFWRRGFPADLIPSSEIGSGALKVGRDGAVSYGPQRYAALVLYHPQFEPRDTPAFLRRACQAGGTRLLALGEWTRDFLGQPSDARAELGDVEWAQGADVCVERIVAGLREAGVAPQTPATATVRGFGREIASPPSRGVCRLIDGTHIMASGEDQAEGDPITGAVDLGGCSLSVDAVGVLALRLGADGRPAALAAGGLRSIEVGDSRLSLDEPVDLALWRDRDGRWRGVLQGLKGPLPRCLAALTQDWGCLALPAPMP